MCILSGPNTGNYKGFYWQAWGQRLPPQHQTSCVASSLVSGGSCNPLPLPQAHIHICIPSLGPSIKRSPNMWGPSDDTLSTASAGTSTKGAGMGGDIWRHFSLLSLNTFLLLTFPVIPSSWPQVHKQQDEPFVWGFLSSEMVSTTCNRLWFTWPLPHPVGKMEHWES